MNHLRLLSFGLSAVAIEGRRWLPASPETPGALQVHRVGSSCVLPVIHIPSCFSATRAGYLYGSLGCIKQLLPTMRLGSDPLPQPSTYRTKSSGFMYAPF